MTVRFVSDLPAQWPCPMCATPTAYGLLCSSCQADHEARMDDGWPDDGAPCPLDLCDVGDLGPALDAA